MREISTSTRNGKSFFFLRLRHAYFPGASAVKGIDPAPVPLYRGRKADRNPDALSENPLPLFQEQGINPRGEDGLKLCCLSMSEGEENPQKMKCPKCKNDALEEKHDFCFKCGHALRGNGETISQQGDAPQTDVTQTTQDSEMNDKKDASLSKFISLSFGELIYSVYGFISLCRARVRRK